MPAGLQFVLFLPDGSKSLIPADWTDFKPAACAPQTPVLVGSQDDLLRLRGLVDALLRRSAELPVISGAVQESHAATDSELQRRPDSGDAPMEQFDDEQKRIVIETLARLLVQSTRDQHQEQTND